MVLEQGPPVLHLHPALSVDPLYNEALDAVGDDDVECAPHGPLAVVGARGVDVDEPGVGDPAVGVYYLAVVAPRGV